MSTYKKSSVAIRKEEEVPRPEDGQMAEIISFLDVQNPPFAESGLRQATKIACQGNPLRKERSK